MKRMVIVLGLIFMLSMSQSVWATDVSGVLPDGTVLTKDESPYIVTGNIITNGSLTIEPGVQVKFNGLYYIQVNGKLTARGTEAEPILFTSNKTSPAAGDWDHIELTDSSVASTYNADGTYQDGNILEYVTIEYGGGGTTNTTLHAKKSPYFNHVTIQHNNGGGVYLGTSSLIENSVFDDNKLTGYLGHGGAYGGAIYMVSGPYFLTLRNCQITNNQASSLGGAVYFPGYHQGNECILTVSNCTFSGNRSDYNGGAINAGGILRIRNSTFDNNQSQSMGGAIKYDGYYQDEKSTFYNCRFTNNTSNSYGGGAVNVNIGTFRNCIFIDNVAQNDTGGAVRISAYGTIQKSVFDGNNVLYGDGVGGAISLRWRAELWDLLVINNFTKANSSTRTASGGALFGDRSENHLFNIANSYFINNYSFNEATSNYVGNALDSLGRFFMESSLVYNNKGNGILLKDGKITDSTVYLNGNYGIYITQEGQPTLLNSNIFGNLGTYDVYNNNQNTSKDIPASPNYWGTTDLNTIEEHIYHRLDDATQGTVLYGFNDNSYLTEFAPNAPPIPDKIVVSPKAHEFYENDKEVSLSQTFAIANAGAADLVIGELTIEGDNASEFTIANNQCNNKTILPNKICLFDVKFNRQSGGDKFAQVVIPSNDTKSRTLIPVSALIPKASEDSYSVDEGKTLSVAAKDGVLTNDQDSEKVYVYEGSQGVYKTNTLTAKLKTGPKYGTLTLNSDGSFTYTPNGDYSDSFTYVANDGAVDSAEATVKITVRSINKKPSFTATNPTVKEDEGTKSIPNWATFNAGSEYENTVQKAEYTVTVVTGESLFSTLPSISPEGTLSFKTADNANGTATFKVRVKDDGGTANGGVDTSDEQEFTLTVTPVNDQPSFAATNPPAVDEDAGTQTVNNWASFVPGPADEASQTATYTVSNISNTSLFETLPSVSSTGVLTYTPKADANGSSTFDVTVKDSGGTDNGGVDTSVKQTFTITVNPVNDAPSFTASNPTAVNEDAGAQTVENWATNFNPGPSDESSQTIVSYTVSNVSNTGLFDALPSVDKTGKLTYTPKADMHGTSTFDVTVKDDGGTDRNGKDTSDAKTFTITVKSVNDQPSFAATNPPAVDEDAGTQTVNNWASFVPGPADEASQTATYTVSNISNTSLFETLPSVSSTGVLTYTPKADANGSSTFDVTVKDSGGTDNGGVDTSVKQTFTITVNPVNDAPSFTASDPAPVNKDAGPQTIENWATNFNPGPSDEKTQTVKAYIVSDVQRSDLFTSLPTVDTNGTLKFTPNPNASGSSTFKVAVQDTGGTDRNGKDTSEPQTFTIKIIGKMQMEVQGNGITIVNGDTTPDTLDHTDFGETKIDGGQIVRTFTIINDGDLDLNLTGIPPVTINYGSDFSVIEQPESIIPAKGKSEFKVKFDPSDVGIKRAEISIPNETVDDPYTFIIQGTGTVALVINEVDVDQGEMDQTEFIEIYNASSETINLDGYIIELVNNSNGAPEVYHTIHLDSVGLEPGGYYVICNELTMAFNCDQTFGANIVGEENANNVISDTLPSAVALKKAAVPHVYRNGIYYYIDRVSYGGNTVGFTEEEGTVADSNTEMLVSLSRYPNGKDTNHNRNDFSLRCITPGAANSNETSSGCYQITIGDITVKEGNTGTSTANIPVNLSAAFPAPITVTYSTSDDTATAGSDYTAISERSVIFNTGETTKTIPLTILGDQIKETDERFWVNLTKVSPNAVITDHQGGCTIQDDDTVGLRLSSLTGRTSESGSTSTFFVALATQPTGDVVIDVTSSDTNEGDVSPKTLTFTPTNWNTQQMVTVTGIDDTVEDGDKPYQVILSVNRASTTDTTGYLDVPNATVSLVNEDNDRPIPQVPVGIIIGQISGNTGEDGTTASFTVTLESRPSGMVVLDITSSNTAEGVPESSIISFNSDNWNIPQTVVIKGIEDWIDDGDQSYTINISVNRGQTTDTTGYAELDSKTVRVINRDNDTAGFIYTPASGNTHESGTTATFTLALTSQPIGSVSIDISSSKPTEGSVTPEMIHFTSANWNVPQPITATGIDDDIHDGDQSYKVVLTMNSTRTTDPAYKNLDPTDVELINKDDDRVGMMVSPLTGKTKENGSPAVFTVVLTSQPTGEVIIDVTSTDETEGVPSHSLLSFTPDNWNVAQTVTVIGVDDTVVDGNKPYQVIFSINPALTKDTTGYQNVAKIPVSLVNEDNDKPNESNIRRTRDLWLRDFGIDVNKPSEALADPDTDGLTNLVEYIHVTDPTNPDSDGDGVSDMDELRNGTDPLDSNMFTPDQIQDSDNDGIPDWYEIFFGLNPFASNATIDSDGDGLTDKQEFDMLLDPLDPDSDMDGIDDGAEIDQNTNPLDPTIVPKETPCLTCSDSDSRCFISTIGTGDNVSILHLIMFGFMLLIALIGIKY